MAVKMLLSVPVRKWILACSAGVLIVASAAPARAQTFGPPLLGEVIYQLEDREGNVRFTLSAYYTRWENPFRFLLTVQSPTRPYNNVSGVFRLLANTPASPLVEGAYALNRHWGIGFWFNPIRGEELHTTAM